MSGILTLAVYAALMLGVTAIFTKRARHLQQGGDVHDNLRR